jgi:hypothetical protein
MFANIATQSAPPLAGFNGATLLLLIALAVAICYVCAPRRSMQAPADQITGKWRAHYITEHRNDLTECRACERGNHPHEPHPAETGAPCECSCRFHTAA